MATAWLNENVANVIAVHCLGGKGRTGTHCVSLMLWTRFLTTADEALLYYQNRYFYTANCACINSVRNA